MSIAPQHGHGWTAAILGSIALHGSIYGVLSAIERPAAPLPESEPIMAYIVPASALIPEPPPPVIEPEGPKEPIQAPPPEPEPPPPAEPEPQPETRAERPPDTETTPERADGPTETPSEASETRPTPTRFEWYSAIPDAIARLREAEEQRPQYREFGNLDALTAGARTATSWALDPPDGVEGEALPLEAATWGEDRVWLNDNCYVSRPTPGSVLAEVHRFSNPTMNCQRRSPTEPRDDLFIEARPEYLEDLDREDPYLEEN